MRRARFKVAPNVSAASRGSQKSNTSNVSDTAELVQENAKGPEIPETVVSQSEVSPIPSKVSAETLANSDQEPTTPKESLPSKATPLPAATIAAPSLNFLGESISSGVPTEKRNLKGTQLDSEAESHGKELGLSCDYAHNASSAIHRFKHRAKIRPVLHDGPHRVRTISNTSESEDDARKLSRAPFSPIKKSVTSVDVFEHGEEKEESSLRASKKTKKREKTAVDLKKEALRRKLAKGNVDRSQLTMFDLIYYNPVEPDKPPRFQEKLQMRLKPYEAVALAEERAAKGNADGADILQERLDEEEEIRRVERGEAVDEELKDPAKPDTEANEEEEDNCETLPVPQVRVGPDGEIILDDTSLVIETTDAKRSKDALANAPVIVENSNTLVNYGSWSKRPRSARWTLKETARFYKALAMLGTNFSLMEKLFLNRPRIELKRKFKLEEKNNRQLVDKILAKQIPFDPSQFFDKEAQSESDGDRKKGNQTKKKSRKRKSAVEKESEVQTEVASPLSKPKRKRSYKSQSVVDSDSSEVNDVSEVEKEISDIAIVEETLSPVKETEEINVNVTAFEKGGCSPGEKLHDADTSTAATLPRSEEKEINGQSKDDDASCEEVSSALKSKPKFKGKIRPNVSKFIKKPGEKTTKDVDNQST